jgi:hypothetical protein
MRGIPARVLRGGFIGVVRRGMGRDWHRGTQIDMVASAGSVPEMAQPTINPPAPVTKGTNGEGQVDAAFARAARG